MAAVASRTSLHLQLRGQEPRTATLQLLQPTRGYRFNVDSLHLIEFAARGRTVDVVCDLGAGCGVVGLGLLALGYARRALLVELDAEQAAHCDENLRFHGLTGETLHADVAAVKPSPAGLVVCNPPYFSALEGRLPSNAMRSRARVGSLELFTRAAGRITGARGRACFVYPARSATNLMDSLRKAGLEPKRLCFVHPRPAEPARLVLVEAKPGRAGGLVVEPPLTDQL